MTTLELETTPTTTIDEAAIVADVEAAYFESFDAYHDAILDPSDAPGFDYEARVRLPRVGADWTVRGPGPLEAGQVQQLIAQREELFFVDLSCDHCGSQAVAIVTIQIDGETATLEGGELVRAEDAGTRAQADSDAAPEGPPISADDVLDAHDLLDDFEGDVYQLIARFGGKAP